jgi:uncharacterized Zn-finger protein
MQRGSTGNKAVMTQKPPEIIVVDDSADQVSCDGGTGALGHPRVWYSFDAQDQIECGYCDRAFIKKKSVNSNTSMGT